MALAVAEIVPGPANLMVATPTNWSIRCTDSNNIGTRSWHGGPDGVGAVPVATEYMVIVTGDFNDLAQKTGLEKSDKDHLGLAEAVKLAENEGEKIRTY